MIDQIPQLRQILIERRRALGLGQRKLAESMDTSQSVVSDLETGVTANPGLDLITRWCQALHVDLSLKLEMQAVTVPPRSITLTLTKDSA